MVTLFPLDHATPHYWRKCSLRGRDTFFNDRRRPADSELSRATATLSEARGEEVVSLPLLSL